MGGGLPGMAPLRNAGGATVCQPLGWNAVCAVSGTWHWRQEISSGCGVTGV
jgi:hypothetical protein